MLAKGDDYCFWPACCDLRFLSKPLIGRQSVAKFLRKELRADLGSPQSRSPCIVAIA
jgi:hypothetical protein